MKKKMIQKTIKSIFDFLFSLILLIVLFPFFIVIAVSIKLDSKGPVFFLHERIGKDGKPFYPFKFRTMKEGAIKEGLKYNIAENDERITRIGKFLREWSIDELPQLINILKGEMSFIGPRPTFRYQVEKYNNFQKKRLLVKPGITGWAQVNGRNILSWEKRIEYDVWYIDNWSLWLDFKILLKTVTMVLSRKDLYGKGGVNDPFV
jgi:undecaprenyl phosphate N,N'-diacetylbacillosamine 1-phosphate transferase